MIIWFPRNSEESKKKIEESKPEIEWIKLDLKIPIQSEYDVDRRLRPKLFFPDICYDELVIENALDINPLIIRDYKPEKETFIIRPYLKYPCYVFVGLYRIKPYRYELVVYVIPRFEFIPINLLTQLVDLISKTAYKLIGLYANIPILKFGELKQLYVTRHELPSLREFSFITHREYFEIIPDVHIHDLISKVKVLSDLPNLIEFYTRVFNMLSDTIDLYKVDLKAKTSTKLVIYPKEYTRVYRYIVYNAYSIALIPIAYHNPLMPEFIHKTLDVMIELLRIRIVIDYQKHKPIEGIIETKIPISFWISGVTSIIELEMLSSVELYENYIETYSIPVFSYEALIGYAFIETISKFYNITGYPQPFIQSTIEKPDYTMIIKERKIEEIDMKPYSIQIEQPNHIVAKLEIKPIVE